MSRRRLVSSDEAVETTSQHKAPCGDCPWRRDSLNGWLGSGSPGEWIETAHGDGPVDCHTLRPQQCAGVAIYRANICKSPRDPDVLRLPADRKAVFASPAEFREHHGKRP